MDRLASGSRHTKPVIEELLTEYGQIDLLFLDGSADPVKAAVWGLDARVLVSRGEMETPELTHGELPEDIRDEEWEACMTVQHRALAYKPTPDGDEDFHRWKWPAPDRPPRRDAREGPDSPAQRRVRTGRPLPSVGCCSSHTG